MITHKIAENAGKIWQVLNENGEMTFLELKEIMILDDQELLLAIGWLSREGVMFFSSEKSREWTLSILD